MPLLRHSSQRCPRAEGCKYLACGATRNDFHDWSEDCERCATRKTGHVWKGGKYFACGAARKNDQSDGFYDVSNFLSNLGQTEPPTLVDRIIWELGEKERTGTAEFDIHLLQAIGHEIKRRGGPSV